MHVDAVVDGSQVTQTVAAAGDENTTIDLNLAIDLGGDSTSVVTDPDTDQPATQGGADKDGTESIDEVVVTLTEGEMGWAALPAPLGAPVQEPARTWNFNTAGARLADVQYLVGSLTVTPAAGFACHPRRPVTTPTDAAGDE